MVQIQSHSPTERTKRKSKNPPFSYSEAVFDAVLCIVGTFLLAWLDLPAYAEWIVVAAVCVVFIVGVRFFRLIATPRPPSVQQ